MHSLFSATAATKATYSRATTLSHHLRISLSLSVLATSSHGKTACDDPVRSPARRAADPRARSLASNRRGLSLGARHTNSVPTKRSVHETPSAAHPEGPAPAPAARPHPNRHGLPQHHPHRATTSTGHPPAATPGQPPRRPCAAKTARHHFPCSHFTTQPPRYHLPHRGGGPSDTTPATASTPLRSPDRPKPDRARAPPAARPRDPTPPPPLPARPVRDHLLRTQTPHAMTSCSRRPFRVVDPARRSRPSKPCCSKPPSSQVQHPATRRARKPRSRLALPSAAAQLRQLYTAVRMRGRGPSVVLGPHNSYSPAHPPKLPARLSRPALLRFCSLTPLLDIVLDRSLPSGNGAERPRKAQFYPLGRVNPAFARCPSCRR